MKFSARVRGLGSVLEPVLAVATTGGLKDYENNNKVTLVADQDGLIALVDNGMAQSKSHFDQKDHPELDYAFEDGGSVTVKAKELKEVISSFNEGDVLNVRLLQGDGSEELRFEHESDAEIYQSLSTQPDQIGFPQMVADLLETVEDSFTIRRDIFNTASNRLSFAHGYEDFRPEYKYWVIRANSNSVRFVAGTGSRFAILEFEGDGLTSAEKQEDILLPVEQNTIVNKLVSKSTDENVEIIPLDGHLVVRTHDHVLCLPHYQSTISWPDESRYLNRDSKNKMTTRLGEWPAIVKGIDATNTEEFRKNNEYHIVDLTIDPKVNKILVEASGGNMRAKRKAAVSELVGGLSEPCRLRVESLYISEAFRNAGQDDYAQWEFEGEGKNVLLLRFNAAPDVSDPDDLKRVNEATGLTERFTIFMATHADDI